MKHRKSIVSWCITAAVACSLGMMSHNAAASDATGYLAIGDGRIEFTDAYAIVKPNPYDDTRENVMVFLTDHPFSDEAVEDEWARREWVEEKGIRYVELDIASNESTQWVQMFGMRFDPSGSSY